jgi:hypothetical protein
MEIFSTQNTYIALLTVQALHLIHHRLAKRHISFVECITALVLIYQPTFGWVPDGLVSGTHCILIGIQIIGSIWIKRLSPNWSA